MFVGVEHPERGVFPERLVFLESYAEPQRSSRHTPISIGLLIATTLRMVIHVLRDALPMRSRLTGLYS